MTISERIAEAEAELNQATAEMNGWNVRRLRAEGALIVLRQLEKDNETSLNSNSAPVGNDLAQEPGNTLK